MSAGLVSAVAEPTEMLAAIPILVGVVGVAEQIVVVAPDLGAVKLTERVAGRLGRPLAVHRSVPAWPYGRRRLAA